MITVVVHWVLMKSEESVMGAAIVSAVNVQKRWIAIYLAHSVKERKTKYIERTCEYKFGVDGLGNRLPIPIHCVPIRFFDLSGGIFQLM